MIILLFLFIFAPLTILIHEFGHVLGAMVMRATHIEMMIGTGKKIFTLTGRKWKLSLHLLYFLGAHTSCERQPFFSKIERIIISSSGPLLNGIVGFFLHYYIPLNHLMIWELFVLFNFWLFLINLIPYRIGGKPSDGYTILQLLKRRD